LFEVVVRLGGHICSKATYYSLNRFDLCVTIQWDWLRIDVDPLKRKNISKKSQWFLVILTIMATRVTDFCN